MGDGIRIVLDCKLLALETLLIINVVFRLRRNARHRSHGFHRVFTCSGFAGKHERACAVINRICHIRDFGTRGTRVMDHGFEHLRCGNHTFAAPATAGDEAFLNRGQLFKRNFNAQVAPGHHDAVACVDDFVDLIHAGSVLDFGDQVDGCATIGAQKFAYGKNILFTGHERAGHEINAQLHAQQQIRLILRTQVFLAQHLPGEAHAFTVRNLAANEHMTGGIGTADCSHLQNDKTVVEQNPVSRRKLFGQLFIGNGDPRFIPRNIIGCKGERISPVKRNLLIGKSSNAVFRALSVQHHGKRHAKFVAHALHKADFLRLFLLGTVRKVQARHVHAGFNHAAQRFGIRAGWADGTDDFRLFFRHISSLQFLCYANQIFPHK